jgi:8-oxo-dGTP diphosphatase
MTNDNEILSLKSVIEDNLPSLSIDLVIFGFHENHLKILLLKNKDKDSYTLPGGFIAKEESLETAANRLLFFRTGLNDIFLQQFHAFGDPERTRINKRAELLQEQYAKDKHAQEFIKWVLNRFITIGFYALVEFTKVEPKHDIFTIECQWHDVNDLPLLVSDHQLIIETALKTLRQHLNYQPIGLNLLPNEFTMPELQSLYETILGKNLDRRNFQRKMLSYKILERLPTKRKGGAYKSPYLYQFDKENYEEALRSGLKDLW